MDLTISKVMLAAIVISLYIIGIIVGYHKGKKSHIMLPHMGTILVNPNANLKKQEPAFKMQITQDFINTAYSDTLAGKIKYVIFEIREEEFF